MAGVSRLNSFPPGERLLRGKRLALVFGVSGYARLPPLPSATKDARAMAGLFRSWGYTLISGGPVLNATKAEMEAALGMLRAAVVDGCTVVVYFTGHGMGGFLLPSDALPGDGTCRRARRTFTSDVCVRVVWCLAGSRAWCFDMSVCCAGVCALLLCRIVCLCLPRGDCPAKCPTTLRTYYAVSRLLIELGTDFVDPRARAVVCLLLDCCRVSGDTGLPPAALPAPPSGCVCVPSLAMLYLRLSQGVWPRFVLRCCGRVLAAQYGAVGRLRHRHR
jgi:hypothetical protein